MPSDEDVINSMQAVKPRLVDIEGAERERIDELKELCKKWWESPDGRKSIKNAFYPSERFKEVKNDKIRVS